MVVWLYIVTGTGTMVLFSVFDVAMYLHRLDPDAHVEDSPTAVKLAAVNGHINNFAALTARLKIDPGWFQLAQVDNLSTSSQASKLR